MKNIFIIAVIALASCTTTRKTSESQTVHTESERLLDHQESAIGNTIISETRDSAIGVQARQVHDSISNKLLQVAIPYTAHKSATKEPVYKEKTVNGLKAWISIDTSGNIKYGASSDSFALLVRKLQSQRDSIYSQVRNAQFIETITKDTKHESTKKDHSNTSLYFLLFSLFFLIVGVFAFTVNHFGKRWIK